MINVCVSCREREVYAPGNTCLPCQGNEALRRIRDLEKRLAEEQARGAALRAAGVALLEEGIECLGRPTRCDEQNPCGLCLMRAALALPTDSSALRALLAEAALRGAHDSEDWPNLGPEGVADAILKGES